MKTIKITLIAIFTLIGLSGIAQEKTKSGDREARKNAYLTKQLALTESEQKAFLPIYKQYRSELTSLRKASKASQKKGKIMSELNDQELEEVIQASFDDKQKILDVKKKYHGEFKKVISMKKVAKLYHIEKRMGQQFKGKNRKGGKGKRTGKRTGERPANPTIEK